MVAEAASGGEVATSGVAAVLFGGILYLVLRYVAQPWGYFSHSEGARRLFLGVPILLAVGGLIAIVVGITLFAQRFFHIPAGGPL